MYIIKHKLGEKKVTQKFDKLKDARAAGIKFFPDVSLVNKKGVHLPF
jgi:hypothetical protein